MKYNEKIVTQWFAQHSIPVVPEYRFDPERKWRFDFAIPSQMIALEVEGGAWTGGRHTRGSGFVKDIEKYNRAAVLGWRVFRCVPDDLCTMDTVEMLRDAAV